MTVTLTGAAEFNKALAQLESDVADAATVEAAGDIVLEQAKRNSRSRRVRRTGRVNARDGRAVIEFGSPSVPWTVPSHFGHGSASSPRAQGGWMPRNPYLYDAIDQTRSEVGDLFIRHTNDAIRKAGLA